MGNSSSSPSSPDKNANPSYDFENSESDVFTKKELSLLNKVYQKLLITPAGENSLPSRLLFDCMIRENVLKDFYQFQSFVEKCTRSNMTTVIKCIWNLIEDKCDDNILSNSTNNYSYRLINFFTMC